MSTWSRFCSSRSSRFLTINVGPTFGAPRDAKAAEKKLNSVDTDAGSDTFDSVRINFIAVNTALGGPKRRLVAVGTYDGVRDGVRDGVAVDTALGGPKRRLVAMGTCAWDRRRAVASVGIEKVVRQIIRI